MRRLVYLLIITLICGCSFIMSENEDLKTIGISRDNASKLNQDIETQRPDAPAEIRILQKEEEAQEEEPAPVVRPIK